MTNGREQGGNFWSMGDTLTKTASPAGSQHLAADAMRALQSRDINRAIKSATAAVQTAPSDPQANLALALALEMSGKFSDAERHYAVVIKQNRDSVPALMGFGR